MVLMEMQHTESEIRRSLMTPAAVVRMKEGLYSFHRGAISGFDQGTHFRRREEMEKLAGKMDITIW